MNIFKGVAVLMVLLCLGLCSCTDDVSQEEEVEKITLTFSYWEPGVYNELGNALQSIAEEYEILNPSVNIELMPQPVEGYQDWIKSTVVSDTMPDIQSNHTSRLAEQYRAGLIVDITDFMNGESAYEPGVAWKDTFIEERLEQANCDYQNSLCNIPFFGTELGIFYNKSIYEELGLSVPQTWGEFMNNCEIIKNSGKNPIVMMTQKSDARQWLGWEIGAGLCIEKYLADDRININNDNKITDYEVARAIISGELNMAEDEAFQECYKMYIEHLEQYLSYCPDSLELEESVAKAVFLSGEAAHINTGSWDVQSLMKNTGIEFEVGVFRFPVFTSEDSPYAGKGIGSSTTQSIAITKSVYKTEGKLEAAIDFMQYFTQKDVYQTFIDMTTQIPTVKDVDIGEEPGCFIYDGYPATMLIIKGDNDNIIYDILSGNPPVLDDKFFGEKQAAAMENAIEYMNDNNISAENNYYIDEKQYGGEFLQKD